MSDNILSLEDATRKLEDTGFKFNKAGQLHYHMRNDDKPYEYNQRPDDQEFNQCVFDIIAEDVLKYVFSLLVHQEGLLCATIPLNKKEELGHTTSFIFHSPNLSSYEKLLVLIQGSGEVRAGIWSRKLTLTHSLESGTQIPFIQRAKQLGYGVVVLNPNQNKNDKFQKVVEGSETPEAHFTYVWRNFVKPSKVKHVAIVAHSYGGVITMKGAAEIKSVSKRTFAVAFTDSVHDLQLQMSDKQCKKLAPWITNNTKNWVCSQKSLNTKEEEVREIDSPRVSAGTTVHQETSWKAFDAVWEFIEKKAIKLPTKK